MTSLATRTPKTLPKTFKGLNDRHALRPIRDGAEYDAAVEWLDRLAVLPKPNRDQRDFLETLTELVAKYDRAHHALDRPAVAPLESLKFLLEANAMNASSLGDLLGNRALGSKILRGERELSKAHIRILADRFRVSPGLFL